MRKIFILFLFTYSILQASFLMPEEAFKPYAKTMQNMQISTGVTLGEDIYLYEEKVKVELIDSKNITIKHLEKPLPLDHEGELVYLKSPNILIDLQKQPSAAQIEEIQIKISFQGCSEKGLCYEPMSETFTLSIDTSKIDVSKELPTLISKNQSTQTPEQDSKDLSETDSIADTIKNESVIITLLTFLGFGLLLALTPCVFPMIPIISGVIISHGHGLTTKKAFLLSVVYVLSMAVAYTIAGVLAGLFGANLQAALQNPWVIYAFAGIFVALALSMFGLYEIKAPDFIVQKASENSHGTGFIGVAVMGFLSALIVGPCVAAPLAGALVYIGQTGDAVLGGMALFSLSIGMGIPLIVVGVSAGRFMPKPGVWMTMVSVIFGVMMLGVAIWMLDRVVDENITMALYAILGISFAIYLGALEAEQHIFKKIVSVVLFIYFVSLFIGVLAGNTSFTQPLKFLQVSTVSSSLIQKEHAKFIKVTSLETLDKVLKEHKGKKLMLDFYADWCTSCKELEEVTFSDQKVIEKMKDFVLVKADITANSDENKKLAQKYKVFGPPAILFFDESSEYIQSKTIIGFIEPQNFLDHLNSL